MTYTPADPYTPYFPGSTTLKPDTILNGQDILYSHVAPLWDEVIKIQNVLRGQAGAALFSLSASTSTTPLAVQGLVSQTADLFKVSSSSSELFKVAASGKVTSGEIAATAATNVFGSYLAVADAQPSFRVSKTGELSWGVGGSSSTDANLYRGSAGLLRSDNDVLVGSNPSAYSGSGARINSAGAVDIGRATNDSANALSVSIASESQYRFRINSAGSLGWSSGSGSIDATLARSGSAALTLTGSLAISSTLTVNGKTPVYTDNAALTDSRAPTGPASGDLAGTYPAPTIKSDVALPGAPTTTTALTADSSTKVATTAFVKAQAYATLASPSLTGAPLATTAAVDTNTTQIATTAFVLGQAAAATPAAIGTAAVGTSTRLARADHAHGITDSSIGYAKLNLSGGVVNADVSVSAAIVYSKLNLTGGVVNADVASGAAILYSKLNLATSIVNADVASGAAIAYSKLNLATSIVNADVASGAAIAYSKLNLATSIANADVASGAAIAYSKLNLSGSVTNTDLAGSISYSKLGSDIKNLSFSEITTSPTTLAAGAEDNKINTVNSSSPVTVNIPSGVFALGSQIQLLQTGAGAVTIAASGVTIVSSDGSAPFVLRAQYSTATLVCIKSSPETWVAIGDFLV